jgi:hypothetical protein
MPTPIRKYGKRPKRPLTPKPELTSAGDKGLIETTQKTSGMIITKGEPK